MNMDVYHLGITSLDQRLGWNRSSHLDIRDMDDINMLWMNFVFGLHLWIRGFDRRKFDDLILDEHG
jgi:hypothetical protein